MKRLSFFLIPVIISILFFSGCTQTAEPRSLPDKTDTEIDNNTVQDLQQSPENQGQVPDPPANGLISVLTSEPTGGQTNSETKNIAAAGQSRSGGEALASLSTIRSGRGVSINELNPVNYKTVDPAILLQMGMEQYEVSFIMGERYFNDRSYDRALTEYNKALGLRPNYPEALFSRGRVYQIRGDLNRALNDFDRTINLKKDSPAVYNYRGSIFSQRGDHIRALGDYTQALYIKRDYGDALYNRGYSYRILGQYDRAIEDYSRLIQLEPHNASAYNQRGTALYYKGNDEGAIRDFSEAIRLKPNYALAWHNRGTAHRMAGNTAASNADFDEAKRLGYK
ncbi:MAG: tetratricopeptide repeat protein [Treponema sp.]|jgi:tetratricopeptide (TPR) repeat protein|nr:tetratricopeptide repeat protein [Treponema sp.]